MFIIILHYSLVLKLMPHAPLLATYITQIHENKISRPRRLNIWTQTKYEKETYDLYNPYKVMFGHCLSLINIVVLTTMRIVHLLCRRSRAYPNVYFCFSENLCRGSPFHSSLTLLWLIAGTELSDQTAALRVRVN